MRVLSVLVCILILTSSAFALPFGDVLIQSAIGKSETSFTPLSFWNFGEGWLHPWVPPPSGEQDLQRGGWINTPSAFFSREIDPTFTFVRHTSAPGNEGILGNRNEYVGGSSLFVPLNRRFQLGLFVPFVDSLQSSPSATTFGDVVVTPQVMLQETETIELSAILAIRTPTGETKTGNGKTTLTPSLAIWQELPAGWQWRGGVGMDFKAHVGEGPSEIINLNLAAGNTLTRHEASLGDLTPYLSANVNHHLGSGSNTNFSLTPGIRFFLGYHTYFVSGVGVQLTEPRSFLPSGHHSPKCRLVKALAMAQCG